MSLIVKPLGSTVTSITFEIVPSVELNETPERATAASPEIVTEPTLEVIDNPVG